MPPPAWRLGSVVAVIYNGQVAYGVFGDEGPDNIIGEASYAMAALLGSIRIRRRGAPAAESPMSAFTGASGVVRADRGPRRGPSASDRSSLPPWFGR